MLQMIINIVHAAASRLTRSVKGSYIKVIRDMFVLFVFFQFLEIQIEMFFFGHPFGHFLDDVMIFSIMAFTAYTLYLCRLHKKSCKS